MVDFQNAEYLKLKEVDPSAFHRIVSPVFLADEQILNAYQNVRDGVVFTNKRIITINVQGITGKKKDFTSLPYSKIQLFSIESAGVFDLDCELSLWYSSLGKITFEFSGRTDISAICRTISEFAL